MREAKKILSGAHAVLVMKNGEIILQKKSKAYALFPKNAGKISMFGGGINEGEDIYHCLKRELFEELNLDVGKFQIEKLNVYRKTIELDGGDCDIHVFVVFGMNPEDLKLNTIDREEGSSGLIMDTLDDLLKNPRLTRITRLALEDYKAKIV